MGENPVVLHQIHVVQLVQDYIGDADMVYVCVLFSRCFLALEELEAFW